MDLTQVMSFISTVGFPIFCAVFFLFQNSKQDERFERQLEKMNEVLEKHTAAIQELTMLIKTKLDGGDQ